MYDEQTTMNAYRAGFDEGQKHQKPSPETEEMIEEWRTFKSRVFVLLIGSLTVMIGYGIWVGTIENRIDNNKDHIAEVSESVEKLSAKQSQSDITSAEIRTKLASIEATLMEIKNSLKTR